MSFSGNKQFTGAIPTGSGSGSCEITPKVTASPKKKGPLSAVQKAVKKNIMEPQSFDRTLADPYTCKRVFKQAGHLVAIPFDHPRSRREAQIPQQTQVRKSTQQHDYSDRSITVTTAGSSWQSKLLSPYKANAQRNRIKEPVRDKPYINTSQIKFQDPNTRRWLTSQKNCHRGYGGTQTTNSAITAAFSRWFHQIQRI